MKAVVATKQGASLQDIPTPEPGAGEILVRVHTAGLNRADLNTLRAGAGQPIGMEWSGTVAALGPGVEGFREGDRVMCSGKHGFAEYAIAEVGRSMLVPQNLDMRRAGSLMLALQTAHDAVVTHGAVQQGDIVLVHGAAAGVGLMAAKIARARGASMVVGTSRNAQRRDALLEHGMDIALDSSDPAWVETLLERTEGRGVDVIIDHVAGAGFNDLLKAAAIRGRIVNVGRLGGASGPFDFETHAFKRIRYTGVTFRTRSTEEVAVLTAAMAKDLSAELERGGLTLPLDEEFALQDAAAALQRMATNQHFGKITLRIS